MTWEEISGKQFIEELADELLTNGTCLRGLSATELHTVLRGIGDFLQDENYEIAIGEKE